jgi:hypothetical protein
LREQNALLISLLLLISSENSISPSPTFPAGYLVGDLAFKKRSLLDFETSNCGRELFSAVFDEF